MSRIRWDEIPPALRAAIEDVLGEPVVAAHSQPGGYSPGSADRVGAAARSRRLRPRAPRGADGCRGPRCRGRARRPARALRHARADNILLRDDGTVLLVDWPWGARGVPWFDALSLLINVRHYDPGADIERLVTAHPVFEGMLADAATRVLSGFAGLFLGSSLRPAPPRMPTLRRFQRDQAVVTLDWVRERWEG